MDINKDTRNNAVIISKDVIREAANLNSTNAAPVCNATLRNINNNVPRNKAVPHKHVPNHAHNLVYSSAILNSAAHNATRNNIANNHVDITHNNAGLNNNTTTTSPTIKISNSKTKTMSNKDHLPT